MENRYHAYDTKFWSALDDLQESSELKIDRPAGSRHPRYPEFVYPVDYGYLVNTASMDGGGIDVWIGTLEPKKIDAILCTLDTHKRDSEIKILYGCTENEKRVIYEAMNDRFMNAVMIPRARS